jgi:hypothetical protein
MASTPLKQPDGALTRSDSFLPIASNPLGEVQFWLLRMKF